MFVHSHHSLASQRYASHASLAHSVHGVAQSLHFLPCGTVEILKYVFTLWSRFTGTNAFFIFTRNTPWVNNQIVSNFEALVTTLSLLGVCQTFLGFGCRFPFFTFFGLFFLVPSSSVSSQTIRKSSKKSIWNGQWKKKTRFSQLHFHAMQICSSVSCSAW